MSAASNALGAALRTGAGPVGAGPDLASIPPVAQGVVVHRGAALFASLRTAGAIQLVGPCRHGGSTTPPAGVACLVVVPAIGDPWIVSAEGWSP